MGMKREIADVGALQAIEGTGRPATTGPALWPCLPRRCPPVQRARACQIDDVLRTEVLRTIARTGPAFSGAIYYQVHQPGKGGHDE